MKESGTATASVKESGTATASEAERREEGEGEGGRSEERSGGFISQSETGWYHSSCTSCSVVSLVVELMRQITNIADFHCGSKPWLYVRMYIHVHVCMYMHVHVCMYMHVCICIYMYMCVCTCMYLYVWVGSYVHAAPAPQSSMMERVERDLVQSGSPSPSHATSPTQLPAPPAAPQKTRPTPSSLHVKPTTLHVHILHVTPLPLPPSQLLGRGVLIRTPVPTLAPRLPAVQPPQPATLPAPSYPTPLAGRSSGRSGRRSSYSLRVAARREASRLRSAPPHKLWRDLCAPARLWTHLEDVRYLLLLLLLLLFLSFLVLTDIGMCLGVSIFIHIYIQTHTKYTVCFCFCCFFSLYCIYKMYQGNVVWRFHVTYTFSHSLSRVAMQ